MKQNLIEKVEFGTTFFLLVNTLVFSYKVKKLKYTLLKMEKYLRPTNVKMKKEECQLIFKLRSRSTDLKVNQKNKYYTYECDACEAEDESQEHILQCDEISKMQEDNHENEDIPYEKIMNGTVKEQLNIAKRFSKKMKIIDKIGKRKI